MTLYTVRVKKIALQHSSTAIQVWATNKEEAEQKALEKAKSDLSIDFDVITDSDADYEVESVE